MRLPNTRSIPSHGLRALALATALALGAAAMPTHAQSLPAAAMSTDGTLLSVSAQAETTRVPDIAHLSTGVVTQAADANAAMRANAEQMTRVVKAIRDAGIAERDIRTSGVNLSPQYRYADNQPPAITGYEARNTVDITVREIGELGEIMDALVAVGANQIHGPTFEVDDTEGAYDEARRAAIEKARARAAMYAQTLGMQVRRIVSISEGNGGFGPPVPMMAMARMEKADASTPVSPGESTLSVNLDVVFELGR
ncbi:SIMPL domain-containing protein [Novilysobacter arseniciresistens]|uniref:SIMPL domain-containing protein n=1 Tax=Novilysobacter arseniciresistens TaxID=1385522 RepID=UPI000A5150EA